MFRGAAVGGTSGAAVGLGTGIALAAPTMGISLPVATAIGAGIGAAGGAALGAGKFGLNKVTDLFGASSEQKQDRKLKRQSLNDIYAAGGMSDFAFKKYTSKRTRRFARDEDMDDDGVNEFLKTFAEETAALEKAMEIATETTQERIKAIEEMTGKTSMQIVADAQRLGVNLADPFADFNEQLETLGVTVVKSSEQIRQAISTIMSSAIEGAFETAIKQQEAPLILDEAIKNFRQDYDQNPGEISAEQAKLILGTYTEQLTNAYGGDSAAAYFETRRQIGSKDAPGLAFNEFNARGGRNPLGTLGDEFFNGIGGEAATTALGDMEGGVADIAMQNLGAILARQGKSLGAGGLATARSNFMNMSTEEQKAFFDKVNIGEEGAARLGSPQVWLDSLGITGALTSIDKTTAAFVMAETNAEKEAVLLTQQRELNDGMAKFFGPNAENPEWWSKAALRDLFVEAGIIKEDGDTRTPRGRGIGDTTSSRLSQTLARHNAINSAISGKRTITSAFRTNNLGSLNSDHVTGRAFDLTGNQLGMYKTTVERQGGFAEYHGASADRHLHVVPGPGGPMGDTVSPYSSAPQPSMPITASPSGGGAITLNLNVNGIGIKEAVPLIKAELERSLYEYSNRQ